MTGDREVRLIIKADGTVATKVMQDIANQGKKMASDLEGQHGTLVSRIKTHWLAIAGIIAAGTAAFLTVKKTIMDTANTGEELKKLSVRLGMSVESLSQFKKMAEVSETSLDEFSHSMGIFSKRLYTADAEASNFALVLQNLGMTAKDLQGMKLDDAFAKIATELAKYEDGSAKVAYVKELFGKTGETLIPLINDFGKLKTELKGSFTAEQAEQADKFTDNLKIMAQKSKTLRDTLMNELIPAFNEFLDMLQHKPNMDTIIKQIDYLTDYIASKEKTKKGFFGFLISQKSIDDAKREVSGLKEQLDPLLMKQTEEVPGTKKLVALPDTAALEKIKNLNAELLEQINKYYKRESENIDALAKKYREQGADRVLIEQWVAMKESELLDKQIDERIKANQEWLDKYQDAWDAAYGYTAEQESKANEATKQGFKEIFTDKFNLLSVTASLYEAETNLVKEWGETELEYTKRVLEAKQKQRGIIEGIISEYEELIENAELYGKTDAEIKQLEITVIGLTNQLKELDEVQKQVNATFSEGVEIAVKEYFEELNNQFENGKRTTREFCDNIKGALIQAFDDPKAAIKNLWEFFLFTLKRMAAEAAMTKIILPIGVSMGIPGTAQATAGTSGIGLLGGGGMGLLNTGLIALAGTIGGVNSALGALGGYLLTTSSLMTSGAMASTMISAGLVGSVWGSVVPIVGTIIGGLLGSVLGGLFKKEPDYGEIAASYGYYPSEKQGIQSEGEWKKYVTGGFAVGVNLSDQGWPMTDSQLKQFADAFEKVSTSVKDVLQKVGMDVSGFSEQWAKQIDLKGLDAEAATKKIKEWFAEYVEFASNIDFSQWQKSGEELIDTIDRIITAIEGISNFGDSIDDMINAIEGDTDVVMKFKEGLNTAIDNIKDLEDALKSATDPADAYALAQQLQTAIYETYQAAYAAVKGLISSLQQLEEEAFRFAFNLQKTIDGLRGTSKSLDMVYAAGQELLSRYFNTTDISEKLRLLQLGIEVVNEGLALTIQQIQDSYNARIEALNEEKDIINEQIDALNEQLSLVKAWSSVLDSVKKQISDITTSPSLNPANYLELIGYKRQEIEKMQALYAGTTGEEKAGYATQLQTLINEYLQLGKEGYQFPSPEYEAMRQESLAWLQQIQADAEKYAQSEIDILAQIEALETESKAIDEEIRNLNEQMAQDIKAAQLQAADYYEWIKNVGAPIYQQKIDEMRTQLAEILGDKTATQYLADLQFAAVNELILIRKLLNDVATSLVPGFVPQYASGTDYVQRTGLALVHQGERITPYGGSQGTVTQHIVIAPQITVPSARGLNETKLAEEIVRITEKSVKTGSLGVAIKDRLKKEGVIKVG